MVLVEVESPLVSPGTGVKGWHTFSEIRSEPDDPNQMRPFGYSFFWMCSVRIGHD